MSRGLAIVALALKKINGKDTTKGIGSVDHEIPNDLTDPSCSNCNDDYKLLCQDLMLSDDGSSDSYQPDFEESSSSKEGMPNKKREN